MRRLKAPAPTVEIKGHWQYAWSRDPYLFPQACVWGCAPAINQATLRWRYGRGRQHDQQSRAAVPPRNLANWYVRISTAQSSPGPQLTWTGVILERTRTPGGALASQPTGEELYTAFGLELLLERSPITRTLLADGRVLPRALPINRRGERRAPNRTRNKINGPGGASYRYEPDESRAEYWTSLDLAEHLLAEHVLLAGDGTRTFDFCLDTSQLGGVADWYRPEAELDGRTVADLLRQLFDRRRLLSYAVEHNPQSNQVLVRPFRFNDSPIDLGNGVVIPANAARGTLDFDAAIDASPRLQFSGIDRFERVEVLGERIVCCGTLDARGQFGPTLTGQWPPDKVAEYSAGASADPDYPPQTERDDRQRRNADARADPRFASVFRHFGPPLDWDGRFRGAGGAHPYWPDANRPNDPAPFLLSELRLLAHLPLLVDHRYDGPRIALGAVLDQRRAGEPARYLPPLVAIRLDDALDEAVASDTFSGERWQWIDRLANPIPGAGDRLGRRWSASVSVQSDACGLVLDVQGGPQHLLARNSFTPPDDSDDTEQQALGGLDYHDGLVATIALQAEERARAAWPIQPPAINVPFDAVRTLTLELRGAELHYVAPDTVVGIEFGRLVTSDGGILRDDRPELERAARIAWQWYARERQALSVTLQQVYSPVQVGDLITSVGGATTEPVLTPVTQVAVSWGESNGSLPPVSTTSIETGFGELDLAAVL